MSASEGPLDFSALADALASKAPGSLAKVGDALGIEITDRHCDMLVELSRPSYQARFALGLPLPQILSLLADAVHRDEPFVFFQRKGRHGHDNVLIVRWDDGDTRRVTMGATNGGTEFVKLWHGYNHATQKRASYEERLFAWARREPPEATSLVFTLTALRSARSRERSEAELLREVALRPNDEDVRQVLSDLWMSRGDPRGELVRLQAERAACTDWLQGRELDEKIEGMLTTYLRTWAGSAQPFVQRVKRGFVDTLRMTPQNFVKHAVQIFSEHPIEHLHVLRSDPAGQHFKKMAARSELSQLRSLVLLPAKSVRRSAEISVGALGAFEHLGRLERLVFRGMGHGATDWDQALVPLRAPKLVRLEFSGCRSGVHVYDALARTQTFHGLRSFKDHASTFGVRTAKSLPGVSSRFGSRLANLVRLEIGGEAAWQDDAVAGFFERAGAGLEDLEMSNISVTTELIERLAKSPSAASLRRFKVYWCPMGPAAPLALIDRARFPVLDSMEFSGDLDGWTASFGDELIERLLALPSDHPLTKVTLWTAPLGGDCSDRLKVRFGRAS